MSLILDIVASANIKDTLTDAQASAAVAKVIGQLPSPGYKPQLLGLQEWDGGAPACIRGTIYRFVRAEGGGSPCIYDSTRYTLLWSRSRTLAPAGFVGHLPGRRSRLEESKATLYCFADEQGGPDTILVVFHLTAEVQHGKDYRTDWKHRLRVIRHKLERLHLGLIVRHNVAVGRRTYAVGDTNFDGMTLPPLVPCWDGHRNEEAAGTLGGRSVDYVFAPDQAATVRRVATASDHDAVVAKYIRRSI